MEIFDLEEVKSVKIIQIILRKIAEYYNNMPLLIPNGIYGADTKEVVRIFQKIYMLNPTGNVDNKTWNKILKIYRNILI